jgi:hypothetical protein
MFGADPARVPMRGAAPAFRSQQGAARGAVSLPIGSGTLSVGGPDSGVDGKKRLGCPGLLLVAGSAGAPVPDQLRLGPSLPACHRPSAAPAGGAGGDRPPTPESFRTDVTLLEAFTTCFYGGKNRDIRFKELSGLPYPTHKV